MILQCWLHIGTEKTGTTAIQRYLALNRHALLAQGHLYPDTPPGTNTHIALTAYALDDHKADSGRESLGLGSVEQLAAFRREFPSALECEIAKSGASTIILSNEHLSARLRTATEMRRIKYLCDRIATGSKVIVYLRNQVDYLVSGYSQYVIDGGTAEFAFDGKHSANYATILDRWASVFGRENITVRRFEREEFHDDLLGDFVGTMGIDTSKLISGSYTNRSLDAASIAFLRAANRLLPAKRSPRIETARHILVALLRRRRHGTKFLIPQALGNEIEAAFKASNDQVLSLYFARREPPLFSPPALTRQCDDPSPSTSGPAAILGVAVTLVPHAAGWFLAQLGGWCLRTWQYARAKPVATLPRRSTKAGLSVGVEEQK
jgi:hypothetical protein